jgi:hypothetical protein
MKQTRGQEFERAWRLVESRRTALQRSTKLLQDHEREHFCAAGSSFAATC